ncbi:glycosyltransferase family 2 protein [Butyrivibrio fibrisolvens]|uniref:glycosyltransferase family 2 protein n=1 Tax=Butyrivibrio fibrisolvens TaxID=831 RepID=UPI000426D48A|nr:glycosyltransferase [Butyrivibrio fibrisolvens]
MTDLISLIVPVYNGYNYIPSFISYYHAQTYKNTELIFIDDGSNDNSLSLMRKYAKEDNRIKVLHQKNRGPSSARNNGIDNSAGKYICFADVDDYIFPDYITYLHQLLTRTNADISFCNYQKVARINNRIISKKTDNTVCEYDREKAINAFCYRKDLTGYSFLKLISRECLQDIRFPENIVYGEDFIFTYNILSKINRAAYGNQIQYLYWQNRESATHVRRDNTQKYIDAWKAHMAILLNIRTNYPSSLKGMIGKCYLLAINNVTRIYDSKRDAAFIEDLITFIRTNAKTVFTDSKASYYSRILGFLGLISPKLTCNLCEFIFLLMEKGNLTFSKTM